MKNEIRQIKLIFSIFSFGMILLIGTSLFWNIKKEYNLAEEYAHIEGEASYNKDFLYRRWAAMHGGVYAPITDKTQPNPHLQHIPNRDITAKETEEKLTLINPAYMTRQVFSIAEEQYGVKGHITSLKPLRPENKADEWETKALLEFEKGVSNYSGIEIVGNKSYMRFMNAMYVEQSCLKCHAHQGYKLGEIRGGISVSVPMDKYTKVANAQIKNLIFAHLSLLSIILLLGFIGYKKYLYSSQQRHIIQKEIFESKEKLKKQNEELYKAKERAEESDRLKTAFLNNMSHEIRTPMNGILGFSHMLSKASSAEAKKARYIEIIQKSGNQLLNIVNDVLDIAKIESGQVKLIEEVIDLSAFCHDIINSYKTNCLCKNNIFINCVDEQTHTNVYADKQKLTQIVNNLISNAIKFTQQGTIKLNCEIKQNNIEFSVSDTGIGIEKTLHEKIFDRFRQADLTLTRNYGGTGLGLSIAKGLVETMKGRIWVNSELGKGTTFYFTIPYKPTNEQENIPTTNPEKDYNFSGIKVLIVEDEEYNFIYLNEILSELKMDISHAKNGKEAVEFVQSSKKIDLILMDIKMPIMNGYIATKEIKKINANIPIIALTAHAFTKDKKKAINAGCDDYLSKPVRAKLLYECIGNNLNKANKRK